MFAVTDARLLIFYFVLVFVVVVVALRRITSIGLAIETWLLAFYFAFFFICLFYKHFKCVFLSLALSLSPTQNKSKKNQKLRSYNKTGKQQTARHFLLLSLSAIVF